MKVALRIRPLSTEEKQTGNHVCIQRGAGGPAGATVDFLNAALGGTAAYAFDDVFDSHADQAAVFTCVQPLLDSFVEGYNATVFAYGQVSVRNRTHLHVQPRDRWNPARNRGDTHGPLAHAGLSRRALAHTWARPYSTPALALALVPSPLPSLSSPCPRLNPRPNPRP